VPQIQVCHQISRSASCISSSSLLCEGKKQPESARLMRGGNLEVTRLVFLVPGRYRMAGAGDS
jgi:hypothetical protein